jgi:endonuclease YncB( thermonuclease family)
MRIALVVAVLFGAAPVLVPARLISVHDGDTFTVDLELVMRPGLILLERENVRLPCGNAAELRADGGGVREREQLRAALGVDAGVLLSTDWSREKYGRLLADPLRPDGGSICGELRDAGVLR